MVAIDTLTYVRRLDKVGVPREQAEAHAEAVHSLVREEVATKADVEAVRHDLRRDIQDTEARQKNELREIEARLKAEIREVDLRLNARIDHRIIRLTTHQPTGSLAGRRKPDDYRPDRSRVRRRRQGPRAP